ncbi:DUF7344 domain-containing protein [Natronococcus wangiae]|uniref:DUF7344 domain-containing protein n=1 Tax=Natronococcus wangiae TaxID=3068275 RepID=UPI00273E44BC|nr:hypothetical protein [Natronococcus sp. AD5]
MKKRENAPSTAESLPRDDEVAILRSSRRRTLLALLTAYDRTLTTNDLTKEIAVRERDESITDVPGDVLARIAISLHHAHIPKLVDAGLVEYDEKRHLVDPTEKLAHLEPRLSRAAV